MLYIGLLILAEVVKPHNESTESLWNVEKEYISYNKFFGEFFNEYLV